MNTLLLVFCLLISVQINRIDAFYFGFRSIESCSNFNNSQTCLFIFGKKNNEAAKEEQMKAQQEILARRRNKAKMREYFEEVDKRRVKTAIESKVTQFAKSKNEVDPIEAWKKAKEMGKIADIGYEPEPSKQSSVFGLNIIIPINPIGIPKYDAGERFDLRLPYAERGYEDPSSDIMSKIGKGWSNLFGGKKTNDEKSNDKNDKNGSKSSGKKKQ